jgi:peptidoglycan/LPS O-acetylase OafA/YrhL
VMSLLVLVPLLWEFSSFSETPIPLAPTIARNEIWLALSIPIAITAFMLATAFAPWRAQAPFATRWVRKLGDISYGIYLIHFPVILILPAVLIAIGLTGVSSSFWILTPIAVALSVGYGYLSGHYLEQPIRRWAHRFGRRAGTGTDEVPESLAQPASTR